MDQALKLRSYAQVENEMAGTGTRVIAVSSGKGGVGKTNSVVNLAIAFSRMGKRVLLLDADLGLGNLDVLLGLAPRYNISHLLSGEKTIDEVLVEGPSENRHRRIQTTIQLQASFARPYSTSPRGFL